jgi:hypothetical protein
VHREGIERYEISLRENGDRRGLSMTYFVSDRDLFRRGRLARKAGDHGGFDEAMTLFSFNSCIAQGKVEGGEKAR